MKKIMYIEIAVIIVLLIVSITVCAHVTRNRPADLPDLPQSESTPTNAPVENTTEPSAEPTEAPGPTWMTVPAGRQLLAQQYFVYSLEADDFVTTSAIPEERVYPASVTKLFTCYVALQYLQPGTMITCGKETTWIDPASSVAWVTPGDRVSVELLIQGMMMQSGNDAAYATAVAAGRVLAEDPAYPAKQAVTLFMEEVNRQAQELGLTGTHFATPDGLDRFDHYTTAQDMLAIALLALENPLLRHYCSLSKTSVMYENGETYTYQSTNYLLQPSSQYYCADACGMKTGTTKKAGSCLMSLFHNGDGYILIGIFGCPKYEDRFADALQLYARYG